MILPNSRDAVHRGQLYRLLIEIADNPLLARNLVFKGGTCAALMGKLDRFSVDLDFDIKKEVNIKELSDKLERIFSTLGLQIKDKSKNVVQYYLKYDAPLGLRNTLKFDAVTTPFESDISSPVYLSDIDRYVLCQTIGTMFAHKLVTPIDRYNKHRAIAGRDIYDIYFFFLNGYEYNKQVIKERTGLESGEFLSNLKDFVEKNITQTMIIEDINTLLPYEKFSAIRKSLKIEVISMLAAEILK